VCSFIELDKKIQTVQDTISDLESMLLDLTLTQEVTDNIFKSLDKYDERLECLIAKRIERDFWATSHKTVTDIETEKEWYTGEGKQLKLEV
jgi:hypothetical protein